MLMSSLTHLQDEREAGGEECHEDDVVDQDGEAGEGTHLLQPTHTCRDDHSVNEGIR